MQPNEEKKYKVVGEIDGFEIGSVVLESVFDSTEVQDYLNEGRLELYVEEEAKDITNPPVQTTGATTNAPEVPEALLVKTLEGKEIISETSRLVNDKRYHHLRLVDGTTQDLTDEEYELKVIVPKHE